TSIPQGIESPIARWRIARSNLLIGMLKQEIDVTTDERIIIDLHLVDESVETAGGYAFIIGCTNKERHRVLVEWLAQFGVFGRGAIHIDRPHSAALKRRQNLVPVAVIDTGRRNR